MSVVAKQASLFALVHAKRSGMCWLWTKVRR